MIKKFFIFVSSPLYIYIILEAHDRVYDTRLLYAKDSTKDNYTIETPVCIHNKYGQTESWLKFEIYAFYSNLGVLIFYLMKSRLTGTG